MSFKQDIEKLIESNLKTYRDNSDRFIADYNRELELTKEYNGRQLLELLQNADDAGSEDVEIVWDKAKAMLTISNKGESFSASGIKSLMLANLTTKTKISYIGNKGLGFRSILNWAELIQIYTNDCKVSFSETIAKSVFEKELNLSASDRNELREERNLTQAAVPFPTLGVPRVEEADENSLWTTRIEISCKREFEKDIEEQLLEIREEILLFLNNIHKITIRENNKEDLFWESTIEEEGNYDVISIKDKSWKVFTRENILPEEYQDKSKNEQQSYSLKVAFQDDLSDNYKKLFNFFPTQLTISLPCIIHGTFELNSSRNHLNESNKNAFILKELVQLLRDCSLFLTKEKIDWRPYQILTPSSIASDSKMIEAFYKELEVVKKIEAIYPCISNQYLLLYDSYYYNDEFELFFMNNFPETLPGLLIPLGIEIQQSTFSNFKLDHAYLVEKIDGLSSTDIPLIIRAELIAQLSKVISYKNELMRFSLLINDSNKIIDKHKVAFTPVIKSEEEFLIPAIVDVDFINNELYELLFQRFENDFDKNEKDKKRELQRIIKSVVNIQPYDSNNVIDKIIAGTKDALKSFLSDEDKIACIKEMITALFANFKIIDNRQDRLKITVPIISKAHIITDAEDLFLSKTFPNGTLTETIYGNSLSSNEYLAEINYWCLDQEELSLVESFFLWLGVNKFSKLKSIQLRENGQEGNYVDFLFNQDAEDSDDFNMGRISKDSYVISITNFEQIKKLNVNHIILLVLKDAVIRKNLEQNDTNIQWHYNYWRTIKSDYSYIRYQFISSEIFTKYLLEDGGEELNKLINDDFQIDYTFLKQFGIDKSEVKSILVKLGAKESFNEITPENVFKILKSIPDKDLEKSGNITQKIYKLSLDSLDRQNAIIQVPEDLLFFAKKGETKEYKYAHEIFYSDNNILPKKILDTLYLINLPKRSGEDKVKKYFQVRSLSELNIQIVPQSIKFNYYNSNFNEIFSEIKPYLLAYRLNSPNLRRKISEEGKKREDEAKAINECKIILVNECNINFNTQENIPIGEREYINDGNIFYYRDSKINSIESLKKDSIFCDAFAEMMCIIFKVNDLKNDFRQILKNDLQDTIHLANQDLEKEKIDEAFQLLGVSRIEIDFWRNVFLNKGVELLEPIENLDILNQQINLGLGLSLPVEYRNVDLENFDNEESFELIKLLVVRLGLSVIQILPNGFGNWHRIRFANTLKDFEYNFKLLHWKKLTENPSEQRNFIQILNTYNLTFIGSIENEIQNLKFELDVDYLSKTKELIKRHFKINIDNELPENKEIENLYEDLLNKFSIEEVDITDESIRSLLYFEGNNEAIESHLKEHYKSDENAEDSSNTEGANFIGSFVDASLSQNDKKGHIANGNGTWVHSSRNDKGKKRKGKKAELLVYNTLVNHYSIENVKWVSGNSTTPDKNDKLHYDIEYKNESGEWKYLEVKVLTDNQFIISGPEKEKGMAEPDKFELALVEDKTIYMVKDVFKFKSGETFESNSQFLASAKDYILNFDINTIKEN